MSMSFKIRALLFSIPLVLLWPLIMLGIALYYIQAAIMLGFRLMLHINMNLLEEAQSNAQKK